MLDMDYATRFPRGLIQVAGVRDYHEARCLIDLDVDVLGIPLHLPVNQPDLTETEAALLARHFPKHLCCITYLASATELLAAAERLPMPFFQLHGQVPPDELARFRRSRPDLFLIKSLVMGRLSFSQILAYAHQCAPFVDAFLTDSFDPATGAEGATGRTHDWQLSRQLRKALPKPLILAGGLHPGNLTTALQTVHPDGVDSHTGLENTDGSKNPQKVRAFVRTARNFYS